MQVILNPRNGELLCLNSYEVKDTLKLLGFKFDPIRKGWFKYLAEEDLEVLKKYAPLFEESFEEIKEYILKQKEARIAANIDVPCPQGKSYFNFQKAFVAFAKDRVRVLLADEMGLGKTIQAIALINYLQSQKVLIVSPAFLKWNWKEEAKEWLVDENLKRNLFLLQGKDLNSFVNLQETLPFFLAIINYDILSQYVELLQKQGFYCEKKGEVFDLIIWDESHYIKNRQAKRTKAALMIKGKKEVFLTGTPILNRPDEVFSFLVKAGVYSVKDYWKFAFKYCEVESNNFGKKVVGIKRPKELRKLLLNFMIRRRKEEVLHELPEKGRTLIRLDGSELKEFLKLEEELFQLREERRLRVVGVERVEDFEMNFKEFSYEDYFPLYAGKVKMSLVRGKEEGVMDAGHFAKLRHLVGLKKVPYCVDFIENLLESEEKVVVMCWHNDVAWFIREKLKERGIEAELLYGLQSAEERSDVVSKFQNDENPRVLVCTMKSAGVGITLTRARVMVFAEQSFVPGDILQAEDRIHRIGSSQNVEIYHLVFSESLDERIVNILNQKTDLISKVVDGRERGEFFEEVRV